MVKNQNQFWSEIGQDIWSVQDFSVNPDLGAANATAYCVWNKRVVWAHLPELEMSGRWTIDLASPAGYTATYEGTYNYVGRGAHRDCCLGSLQLEGRIWHLGLLVTNDDLLPEKINICMKFSSPFDKDQADDARHLKQWSSFPTIASQFPRFLHFSNSKTIRGVPATPQNPNKGVRSVLISEAMGEGKTVGKEMKAIHDDPNRRSTREMFVLCMRFMMWGFELQKEHCKVNDGHLQDMHPENCVFIDGVPIADGMASDHFLLGRTHRYSLFRCVDSNGWWPVNGNRWRDLHSLFGCIFDVIETEQWRVCNNLHPVHLASVRNVP